MTRRDDVRSDAPSLTSEIRDFTEAARNRLPARYFDAFRALIMSLTGGDAGKGAPEVGGRFPDFTLMDSDGAPATARDHWAGRDLIVKFYRGGWCPYCNLELKAFERSAADFAGLGTTLFAVAPEKASYLQATKKTSGARFRFLWDEHNALARRVGIAFAVDERVKDVYRELKLDLGAVNGEWTLPIPATFVVRDGLVRYRTMDADYMMRQDPLDLLAAIRRLNEASH